MSSAVNQISDTLIKKQLSVERFNKPQQLTTVTSKQIDKLLLTLQDLVNEQYWEWYCRECYRLGLDKVKELAIIARKGAQPRKYFSWLLKNTK